MNKVIFVEEEVGMIQEEMIQDMQELTGRTLYEGDPLVILINALAKYVSILKNNINFSANQNILSNVTDEYIDNIGELVGVTRLPPSSAYTTMEMNITEIQKNDIKIVKGTKICDKSQTLYFETIEDVFIKIGDISTTVVAKCQTEGAAGNGIPIDTLTELVDLFPYFDTVRNITVSNGGADREDIESYRERIKKAPEILSTAGSIEAYKAKVMEVTHLITDVSVFSDVAGVVKIVPLTKDIMPSDELIQAIYTHVNDDKIRPLTDYVTVEKPMEKNYNINITYYSEDGKELKNEINDKINEFVIWQSQQLGRDINPSKLLAFIMSISSVKRVEILEPLFEVVCKDSVAVVENITVNNGGYEDA